MSPIRVETGPMYSGKSGSLVEGVKRRLIGKQEPGRDFLVFNWHLDTRYGKDVLAGHNGTKVTAVPLENSKQLLESIFDYKNAGLVLRPEYKSIKALYIDEAQFFDDKLGAVLQFIDLYFKRNRSEVTLEIVVAGLDMDFRGEPFGVMQDIIARAEKVNKHTAVCSVCGENNATRTQRLTPDGKPASYNDEIRKVGAQDDGYTARCVEHHEVPGKPLPLPQLVATNGHKV